MATPAYIPIYTTTLASATSSVLMADIPQGYAELVLVIDSRATSNAQGRITFNGDTGNNYYAVTANGFVSSTTSTKENATTYLNLSSSTGFRNTGTLNVTQIMNYSSTSQHKSLLIRNDGPSVVTSMIAGRYASTTAISSISIFMSLGDLGAGSTFSLFGILGTE